MDTNAIRNYNEITNNGIRSSIRYIEKKIILRTEDDKDACLRFLTINNNILTLCHSYYTDKHLNTIIENSNYLIYFHREGNINDVIAFALVKLRNKNKRKILDILLACAIPNKNRFGRMIAFSLYKFAVRPTNILKCSFAAADEHFCSTIMRGKASRSVEMKYLSV